MLPGEVEPIEGIKIIDPGFPVRRRSAPKVNEPCVVLHLVEAGDRISIGDPVAKICDIWGRPLGEGMLYSEYEGFVVGRSHGIFFYPGDPILSLAIRDDLPLVVPYPENYFKS
jgi:hypothetical protein